MSARPRLWLIFLAIAVVVAVTLAAAGWIAAAGRVPAWLVLAAAVGVIIVALAFAWTWLDRAWIQPCVVLAREIDLLTHGHVDRTVAGPASHGLGPLPDAVVALAERWRASRSAQDRALAEASARVSEQQSRLEAVLRELSDGLIACSADRRILLFNDAALRILGAPPELGLDRPLDGLVAREPIAHAFELLCDRHAEQSDTRTLEAREQFVCATVDGSKLLRCRLALIIGQDGAPSGFILDFADATERLGRSEQRLARLTAQIQELRAPLAALRAAAEVLEERDLTATERSAFIDVVGRESAALSERIEDLCQRAEELAAGDWPMADLFSADLVRAVNRRLARAGARHEVTRVGPGLWLHGDGYHLTLLLQRLVERLAETVGAAAFDLEVHARAQRIALDLVWQGTPVALRTLESWLEEPLEARHGRSRLRDVLRRHDGELWSQAHDRAGLALVRLLLPAPHRPQIGEGPPRSAEPLPPRPEFYDFALLERSWDQATALLERPLGELAYVVFDTETTGLDPAADRVIQIAGVRIVNRRLLTGEVFDALVNPGRTIPKTSIRFHGITDTMVAERPPIEVVLPQFRAFVGDAVLVAHNAAFDVAFLRRDEVECAVRFDNPVLDTLLLSAVLHDHTPEHTLDAIAARFGITLIDRHQALGDAIGTAQIFLKMLDLLAAQGVRTLGEALAVTERAVDLRRRQSEQFGAAGRGRRGVSVAEGV